MMIRLLYFLVFILFAALAVQLVRWQRMVDTERDLAQVETAAIRTANTQWLTRVSDAEAKLRQLEKRLIWGQPAELLPKLGGIADKLSLSLVGVEELRGWRRGGYNAVPLQLTLSGNYSGFSTFLSIVERIVPTARIDEVRLYQRRQHKGKLWMSLTLSPWRGSGEQFLNSPLSTSHSPLIKMPAIERFSVKSNPFGTDAPVLAAELVSKTPLPELTGILWHAAKPIAILGNESGSVGEVIAGATILAIEPQRVIVTRGTQQYELKLWKNQF